MGLRLSPSITYFAQRYLARRKYLSATVRPFGGRFKFRVEDAAGRRMWKVGDYEPRITQLALERFQFAEGDWFVDVGANLGWYSVLVHERFGRRANTLAFEPDPDNFELLRHNLAENRATSVRPLQIALGERTGTATLHRHAKGDTGRHSLLPLHEGEQVEVRVEQLDELLIRQGVAHDRVRAMKLDVEGYEYPALRGATRTLRHVEHVFTRFSPRLMRVGGLEPRDMLDFLSTLGFRAERFGPSGLEAADLDALPRLERDEDLFWSR